MQAGQSLLYIRRALLLRNDDQANELGNRFSPTAFDHTDMVSIRIISPKFSEAYTFLFAGFLESALKTFGYTKFNKDVSRGTIRIKAHRSKS